MLQNYITIHGLEHKIIKNKIIVLRNILFALKYYGSEVNCLSVLFITISKREFVTVLNLAPGVEGVCFGGINSFLMLGIKAWKSWRREILLYCLKERDK
jgi:hypothetical protein